MINPFWDYCRNNYREVDAVQHAIERQRLAVQLSRVGEECDEDNLCAQTENAEAAEYDNLTRGPEVI
jgi:hypothetical protein